MTFDEILDQALALLQRRGRLTYRTLQRQCNLDEAYLADLRDEIIQGPRLAVDEGGAVLVWTGGSAPVPAPASTQEHAPLAYTPAYLAEKILASRAALEGERKQVTVLFTDLKGSTELIAGLDPEEARTFLDPALHVLLALSREYQEQGHQTYALRLLGEIAARRALPDIDAAATHYHQALTLAEALDMRPLQAHCHLGLGTLI